MEGGEDMTSHGAGVGDMEPEDAELEVDADEQENISDAAFIDAGIAPMPDWSPITQAALARALVAAPPPVDHRHDSSFIIDGMLNRIKNRFLCGIQLMSEIDDVLQFLCENPEKTFTHTRERMITLALEVSTASPELTYKVGW